MKKLIVLGILAALVACGSNKNNESNTNTTSITQATSGTSDSETTANPSYDPKRGQGKFKDIVIGAFNVTLAEKGKIIYDTKCQGCHKLTGEKLVGPGWEGITKRHEAAWILNFITNPDAMLDQDPELKNQLEICMVRMPNQNLTDDDAKTVYEFMRQNDGAK